MNRFVLVAGAALAFAVALLVYEANGTAFAYTYDSAPASLFALNFAERHALNFDAFEDGYLYQFGAGYVFAQAPNCHIESIFPIGTALLAGPILLLEAAIRYGGGPWPDITLAAFEPQRLMFEKNAAATIGALAAALCFVCAALARRRYVAAAVVTVAFAFGSEMWTIGALALWQHGSMNLLVLALMALLLVSLRTHGWRLEVTEAAAGLCAGFLPVVRPTALFYALAAWAFVFLVRRRPSAGFATGFILGLLPGLLWNYYAFGSLLGGYTSLESSYSFSPAQIGSAVAGLTVSPSKGLFVYMPWIAFSIWGFVRALRDPRQEARLICCFAASALAIFASYACFERWLGGSSYGPRYLTDVVAVAALLLLWAPPLDPQASLRSLSSALLSLSLVYAVAVQAVGAFGESRSEWSSVPLNVDHDHLDRVWAWPDTQILRDARTVFVLQQPNPAFEADYAPGFRGNILRLAPLNVRSTDGVLRVPAESDIELGGVVRNEGTSRWYGYETGFWYGETRVRARLFDANKRLVRESYLSVSGMPGAGQTAPVLGTLVAPHDSGPFTVSFDVDSYQIRGVSFRPYAPTFSLRLLVTQGERRSASSRNGPMCNSKPGRAA